MLFALTWGDQLDANVAFESALKTALGKGSSDNTEFDDLLSQAVTEVNNNGTNKSAVQKAFDDATAAYKAVADKFKKTLTDNSINVSANYSSFTAESNGTMPLKTVYDAWKASDANVAKFYELQAATEDPRGEKGYSSEETFLSAVCTATKLFPNFTVNYGASENPFVVAKANHQTTITTSTGDILVSGKDLNPAYTVSVNIVNTIQLTGNLSRNIQHQAFYNIEVLNGTTAVTNTGDVTVTIKLPADMNAKNSFVVYYIPQAADGSYQVAKAEAMKNVKVASGYISFTTNHFSVYGIAEYPKGKAPDAGVVMNNESSAAASAQLLAAIATFATTVGTVIIARRHALRKA